MLAGRLSNIPMTVVAVLAASVILLALLLALAFRGLRSRDPEKKWDAWRTVRSALIFLAGPFPISIAIHLAVLLFLIHEVRQAVAPKLINIHLESEGGGGNGGAAPDTKLPSLPDIATPDTAVTGLSLPVPRIAAQQTAPTTYTNEYVRAVNRGSYGSGFGGGFGGGSGGGYGRGIGTGFGGFIGQLRRKGLDVVLVIDGTGSMRFVMDDVKARMQKLVLAIHRLVPTARIGIVQFGGRGEAVQIQTFTTSSQQLQNFLNAIHAQNGSYDWREDTLSAIKAAVDQMQWRPDAKKVIVLVGDTPPWDEDYAQVLQLITKFKEEDGTFNTVDVTQEEHELFEREALNSKTISPLPDFYLLTQRAYQDMARVGGGEWGSLSKDNAINKEVLMLAFGRQWQSQIAAFQTDIATSDVH
ncbi:MAG: vWA domain-containing protein [Candidatus Binataceae bacterium]